MKLNNEQKKLAKNYLVYSAGYMVVYPLMKWALGHGFTWETIWICLITILIVGVINLLLIIGARTPNDK